ncbi:MAG: hypothetical protein ACKOZU_08655 [Planctomycetaceae bacterium]
MAALSPPATDDAGAAAAYRPVSVAAVAAAVIGLASVLALVSPVLWVLPLVGVAVSLAALADVDRPAAAKAGRLAALTGLGLSLGFGAQAVTTAAATEWLARGRAEAAARFWLDAIASGRLDDARSMCAPDAAAAVDRVAACGATAAATARHHGRDPATGARVVRVVAGDCALDFELTATPPRRAGDPERLTVSRCAAVTPSAM